MTSKREAVAEAIKALVVAALPNADVSRNRDKAARTGAGGTVVIRDGDPGDPEIDLSPLTHHYEHPFQLEVLPYDSASKTPEAVLDEMLTAVGAAVTANRTLTGLCDWLDCVAPDVGELEQAGAKGSRMAVAAIVASYSTPSPL